MMPPSSLHEAVAGTGIAHGYCADAEHAAEQGCRAAAFYLQPAHVRHIEQAYAASDCPRLLKYAVVLDGHCPAAEGHDTRAERDMGVVEGGLAQVIGIRHYFLFARELMMSAYAHIIAYCSLMG